MEPRVVIVSGRASRPLAEKIAQHYGTQLGTVTFTQFADGEFQVSFDETIRGTELFIVQSTHAPVENLFELLLLIDAAKRASAHHIYAVVPYYGFARQDRKDKPRVAIGAKMVATMLQAVGIDRLITIDLHSDQIQGFFEVPVDHLFGSSIFVPYILNLGLEPLVIVSPDTGGSKRANAYAKILNCDMAICYKHRAKPNQVNDMILIGDVRGKHVILIDDILDTAGTMVKAADLMAENGAKSIRTFCTHGLFSGNAYEKIDRSPIEEVIVTDTIYREHRSSKVKVISVAELFADVIYRNISCESISTHFKFNTYI
ncbi:MAG: ribose-phosphate pyrophosphokinase [Bacteroidales bacterium]|nr:ribose-phosphate pyrophosphokinase [Bacteroidales bacterium]